MDSDGFYFLIYINIYILLRTTTLKEVSFLKQFFWSEKLWWLKILS